MQISKQKIWILGAFIAIAISAQCDIVPIINYSINDKGNAQLEVNSTEDMYYILQVRNHVDSAFNINSAIVLGASGTTIITDVLEAYPQAHYQVWEQSIADPLDSDSDGIDDMTEYQNTPTDFPLNAAQPVPAVDGGLLLEDAEAFTDLAALDNLVQWSEFLNGKLYVKFMIIDFFEEPKIYFINTDLHPLHSSFGDAVGVEAFGEHIRKGQIIFHPASISNNGQFGNYAFNYSNGHPQEFHVVQKTHNLLASCMPFLENNLSFFVTENSEVQYAQDSLSFEASRIPLLFHDDIYQGIDYIGLNLKEGYGLLRHMDSDETPGPKDIVLYESLPNFLPRVGGIITSVIQTPLSHVNLRAIQNNIPNAYIKDPLENDTITSLLNQYVYYRAEQERYILRPATLDEVNAWYEDIRPSEVQEPPLNLEYENILALDDISFEMNDGFGAKCANLATMRTFGFQEGTIPDGFGVPFYFYQEFMEYNGFFETIAETIQQEAFIEERDVRETVLENLRDQIKAASMPEWMLDELADMHASFPEGTSVRCRSSSNNEDLAGFNGAGLYDSKTQHPHEGHISKSIKQVYASLWNLRAFEERDFYRVNHFMTSMAVLCHPNFQDELANGVGVSQDPQFGTTETYYLNTQVGEDLITNPDNTNTAEVILIDGNVEELNYLIVQFSDLVPIGNTVMDESSLELLRDNLKVIHDNFERLYEAEGDDSFAMDIEYKITSDSTLIIKQARPWVSFNQKELPTVAVVSGLLLYPNPVEDNLTISLDATKSADTKTFSISNLFGQTLWTYHLDANPKEYHTFSVSNLPMGIYVLSTYDEDGELLATAKFIKKH